MDSNKKILWIDEYEVGLESLDAQHKQLFSLVNKLYEPENNHMTEEELAGILYAFSDYMNVHFKDEEEYMLSIGYPDLLEHIQLHNELVNYLTSVIKTHAKVDTIKTKIRLLAERILVNHIVHEDIKIKQFEISKTNPDKLFFDNPEIELDEYVIDITDIEPDE